MSPHEVEGALSWLRAKLLESSGSFVHRGDVELHAAAALEAIPPSVLPGHTHSRSEQVRESESSERERERAREQRERERARTRAPLSHSLGSPCTHGLVGVDPGLSLRRRTSVPSVTKL
jgi:hypothetical protein